MNLQSVRDRIPPARRWAVRQQIQRLSHPAFWGTLRRTTPLSDSYGFDRGMPVDRYYIERFLCDHGGDIRGRVAEVKDSMYTDRFGTGVTHTEVLDIDPTNPLATIVADLGDVDTAPRDAFDCFVVTQTLQYVYDTHAATMTIHRMLRPGGIALITVPAISQINRSQLGTDFWRFTPASCARLFEGVFGAGQVSVQTYGNVLTALAFLSGIAREELSRKELAFHDESYPLIVAIRAVKQLPSPSHTMNRTCTLRGCGPS